MYSILYVDDEAALLEIAKIFLEQKGEFGVSISTSAQEALDSLSVLSYDAIISDYQMPGMDGIEFLKKVRASGSSIPFILFTGRGREEVVIQALNAGADFYLQKGGDPAAQFAELAHKIRQAIARRQAEFSLIESEKRLADIINFLPDATFAIDRSGTVIAWNLAIEEMTGVAAADILGKGEYGYAIPFYGTRRKILIDLIFEPDDIIAMAYGHIIRDKNILIADTTLPRPQGRNVTLMGKASPLYNRQGEIIGAIESIRDITELKKAEENLRESEGRFSAFMDHLPVTAFIKDDQSTNLFVNRRMEECFGAGEWIGKSVHEQFPHEAAEKMIKDDRQTLRDGSRKTIEKLRTQNGDMRIFETYKFRMDREDKPPLIGGFAVDITEQKEAEKALNESEEIYRLVVENSHDAIYIHRDNQLLFVNSRASDLTGYEKNELLNMNLWDLVHPEDRARLQESATRRFAGEEIPSVFTARIITKSGEFREGDFFVDRIIYHGRSAILGIFRDMAEQKRIDRAIREIAQQYRNVVEDQTEFISRFLPDGTHIFVNEAYCRYFGTRRDELLGHRFRPKIPPEDQDLVDRFFLSLTPKNPVSSIEHRIIMPDGSIRWQRWSDRAVFDPSGKVTEYQSVGRDITEEKATRAALQDSEQRFRKIFENSSLGMALSTPDFRFNSVNQAMSVMTGYSEEELKKMSFKDITHPEHLGGDEEHIRELASGKIPVYSTEKRYIRKDGGILWGLLRVTTIRDLQGTLRYFVAMIEDITERKKVEVALQESEERYRQLVEQSPDGIMVHTSGLIVYANPTSYRLLGAQAHQDLAGQPVMNFVHEDFKDTVTERVRVMTEDVKPVALLEEKFLRLDGTSVDVEVAAIPFVFKGKPSVQVTFRDITKRKTTEEILRIAQEKYTKAFLLAPDAITLSELSSGTFIEVNDAATKIFGYSRDEFLKKSAIELGIWLNNDDRARLIDMIRKEGRVSQFEIIGRRKSGEQFHALVDADTISIRGEDYVIAIIRDITSRKRAEEALRDTEELDRAIVNTSPDNITITDLTGTILFVSPASVSMFGLPDQNVSLGKSIFNFIMTQEEERGRQALTTLLRTGNVIGEFNARKSDGSLFPIEAHASLMRDKAGNPWRIIIIVRDITERKRVEEALRQTSKKLTLLSSITRHDIDNQIVALMGFLKILEKKHPDPILSEYSGKISAIVKRISTMIRFTKQYEQIGVHDPVWQDIRTLVRTATKEVPLGKITVKNDVPEMTEVFADPLIVKVFYNLMDNAVKYGGKITVIRFSVRESGDDHLVLCEDNGVGIPADEKKRIFDRDFGQHTGLGLFLSQEILSITGITIRETGEPGKGARFEITVPKTMYRITDFQQKIITE